MNNNEKVQEGFWESLWSLALRAGREVIEKALILYYAAQNPATPTWAKTTIYGALAYLINPFDLVPDMIPGAGFSDDLLALAGAIATVSMYVTPEVIRRAKKTMADLFGDNAAAGVLKAV